MSMNRAVGCVVARGDGGDPMPRVHAPAGYGMGAALNITALVRLPGSHPACQPSAEPAFPLRGRGSFGRVAPARARFALTPERVPFTITWSARAAAARGACRTGQLGGQQADRARSVTLRCQTNLVLSVRSAIFPSSEMELQRSVAVGKWSCSRLLAGGACTHRARRSLAAYCGVLPVRSIAGYCWFMSGGASQHPVCFLGVPDLRPVSPVCGRRNPDKSGWSGRKAGECGQGAGQTVPALAPKAFGEVLAR
jgi:hypothetical protein